MLRMTDVLSRMLNDPAIRVSLSGVGEDNLEDWQSNRKIFKTEYNGESNAERNHESAESNTGGDTDNAGTSGSTNPHIDRAGNSTATNETTDDGRLETREFEEQEHNALTTRSTSTSVNDMNLTKSMSDDVPIETEASMESDAQGASVCSTSSYY